MHSGNAPTEAPASMRQTDRTRSMRWSCCNRRPPGRRPWPCRNQGLEKRWHSVPSLSPSTLSQSAPHHPDMMLITCYGSSNKILPLLLLFWGIYKHRTFIKIQAFTATKWDVVISNSLHQCMPSKAISTNARKGNHLSAIWMNVPHLTSQDWVDLSQASFFTQPAESLIANDNIRVRNLWAMSNVVQWDAFQMVNTSGKDGPELTMK